MTIKEDARSVLEELSLVDGGGREAGSGVWDELRRGVERLDESVGKLDRRVERIEQDVLGDDRGNRGGLWDELKEIRDEVVKEIKNKQKEHQTFIDAYEMDKAVSEAVRTRRNRTYLIINGGLGLILTLLTILTTINNFFG